jgi:hypothetical protein
LQKHRGSSYIHNYSKVFSRNLKTAKRRFRREGKSDESLDLFTLCIESVLKEYEMKERDYSRHPECIKYYRHLVDGIVPVVNGNETDAIIVADAVYWSLVRTRNSPTLVTTDAKDIARRSSLILEEVSLTLREDDIPLDITHVDRFLT